MATYDSVTDVAATAVCSERGLLAAGFESHSNGGCCESAATSPQESMVCMPPHVFLFCIVLSALASGIAVASRRIHAAIREKLRRILEPSRVHNPRLRHGSASRQLDKNSEGSSMLEAAEPMDFAAAAPLEVEHKVPARYVRAFCGDERRALQRWKATLQWRKENDIDDILNEPQPFFHDIRRHFPSYLSGRSRGGHIVVYEKLGGVDMLTLRRDIGVTVPMLLRHWIFVSEYMYRVLQPTDSAQQITVEDMKGVRMQTLAGKIQEYVRAAAQLGRLHYVERCHKTFVVNAPAWFGLAFGMVSPFLSARTRQKIRVLGSDLRDLRDEIDPQFLPVEYGGNMTVPVSESSEERNLRRLVDAINANASANPDAISKTPHNGGDRSPKRTSNSGNGNANSGKPGRLPTGRSPINSGKSPKRRSTPSSVQTIQRSPPRKSASDKPPAAAMSQGPINRAQQQQQQQLQFSPKSDRARARTNDTAMDTSRKIESPPPEQSLGHRRATWAGIDGRERRADGGSIRRRGEEAEAEEGSSPLEDRLQAVMKDLGVPVGEPQRAVRREATPPEVGRSRGVGQWVSAAREAGVTPRLAAAAKEATSADIGGGARGRLVDLEAKSAGDTYDDASTPSAALDKPSRSKLAENPTAASRSDLV